jgi:hypothetical protein
MSSKKIIKKHNTKKASKNKSLKKSTVSERKSSINRAKSFSSLKARITRKSARKFNVERVGKILNILPKFTKFYDKLSPNELMAVKFYKVVGSYFQSDLLANYSTNGKGNGKGKGKSKGKDIPHREIKFPFSLFDEESFRKDIFQNGTDLIPFNNSFDIKDLPKYIENSYKARITLLNRLDKIYDRKDCPKMTGEEILFRGMRSTPDIKNLKVGDTYLFKNFISTTLDRSVAERFSGGYCVFIYMNMKDIPFIYMPHSKQYTNKFSTFMMEQKALMDLSEYTLPRNLEFKIEKIEKKPISEGWFLNRTSFAKLQKTLKKKGYFNTIESQTDTTTTETIPNETNNKPLNKNNLLEEHLYNNGTFYYCTLHNWHPRTPIQYEEIVKDAKFVLDKEALASWSEPLPDWF